MDERQREVEPALHSARVGLHLAVGGVGEPDPLEKRLAPMLALRLRQAVQRRLQTKVLAPGQKWSSAASWRAAPIADLVCPHLADDVESGDPRSSGRRRQQGDQHVTVVDFPAPLSPRKP